MAIEIVDLPIKNGGSFHRLLYVYQIGVRYRGPHPVRIKRRYQGAAPGTRRPSHPGAGGLFARPGKMDLDGFWDLFYVKFIVLISHVYVTYYKNISCILGFC